MLQVKRSPQVFDVVVIGSGAGGGTAVKVLTDLGINVALLEAGPMLNPAKDFQGACTALPGAPSRRRRARRTCTSAASNGRLFQRAQRLLADRRRALHRRARQRVPLVPLAHHRRPHQPLRPHLAALLRLRFQALLHRRPGRRLAGHLRRDRALLRQGRRVHRRHRHQRRPAQRARRQFPAAHSAARARGADPAGLQKARHPVHPVAHGDADQVRCTAAPPAITAASADAAARLRRPSPPARR